MENEEEIFTKRVPDSVGKEYQDLLVAYYAFQLILDDEVQNFKISSDNADYGYFNDIVLEINKSNCSELFAIQARHSTIPMRPMRLMFTSPRAGFSLLQCYESSLKINVRKGKWILFTTRHLTDRFETPIKLSENLTVRLTRCHEFLFLQTKGVDFCWQFEVEEGDEDARNFFENLYLLSDQVNVEEIRNKVWTTIETQLNCDRTFAENYINFIKKWSNLMGKKTKLNKKMVQKLLGLQLLSSSLYAFKSGVANENIQTLQKALSPFQFAIFDAAAEEQVVKLWCRHNGDIDDKNFDSINRQYLITDKQLDDCSDEAYTRILWLANKCPLVVKASESTVNIIQMLQLENIVFLEDRERYTVRLNNCSVFRKLPQLTHYQKLYNQITHNFMVRVNETNFSLHDLRMLDLYFQEEVTSDDLLKIAFELYNFENEKEKISETYICRSITKNLVTLNFLDEVDTNAIIIVDHINRNRKIRRRIQQKHKLVEIDQYLSSENAYREDGILNIYYTEATCTLDDFEKIRKRNEWSNQSHQLRVNSNSENLEWIRSINKVSDLQKFRYNKTQISEEELWESKTENNINLINGASGMGKSELLKNLKNNSRSSFPIYLHPKETNTLCSLLSKTGTNNIATIIKQIIEIKFKNYTPFKKKFLEILFNRGDIEFFWDALDEVYQNLNVIVRVISEISKQTSHWITYRTHLTEQLERDFCVLSRTLCQLTDNEQTSYIMKRIENFVETDKLASLIEKIKDALKVIKREETPLQIFMITEIARQNLQQNMFLLDKVFVETDLYQHFLSERFDSCFIDRATISLKQARDNRMFSRILKIFTNHTLKNYMKAALKIIIPEILDDFNLNCDEFLDDVAEEGDYTGIITEVKNGQPQFIHMSYAEYFVAAFFAKNYEKISNFEDILFKDDYKNIRFFFDTLLAKNSIVHKAVLYKNVDLLRQHKEELRESVDDAGRSVLHLACSWGQRHPFLNVTKENNTYFVDDDLKTPSSSESLQDKEIIKLLLETCDLSRTDGIFNYTPMQYAQKTNCPLAMLNLLQKRRGGQEVALQLPKKNRNHDLVKFTQLPTVTNVISSCTTPNQESDDDQENSEFNMVRLLYYAAKFGHEEAFNIFDNVPFIKTSSENVSILHLSLQHGHQSFVWKLLKFDKYQKAINDRNKHGETLLYKACEYGYDDMIPILIDSYNAIPDIGNKKGFTILHIACQKGHDKVVESLLNYEVDVNSRSNEKFTPLHLACLYGHLQVVILLIGSEATIESITMDGSTPLHLASSEGFGNIVKELIKREANVNAQKIDKTSPLHAACENGHKIIAKMLIDSGAFLEQNTDYECTPLHKACANGHYEVAQLLITHQAKINKATNDGTTPLHMACCGGHHEIANLLITSGADVECYNIKGSKPLHEACSNNYDTIVSLLIDNGASLDSPDNYRKTSLHIASEKGFLHTAELLLNKGADINATDDNNYTPLHLACENGSLPVVELLLNKNADVKIPNKDGWTPLHTACAKGFEAIIRSLCKCVDINILGNNNWTPIHKSCQQGHTKIVRLLLELGADVKLHTVNNESVLFIAAQNNRVDIVDLLVEKGVDRNVATKDGWTALHVASDKGFENVVRKLLEGGVDVNKKTNEGLRAIALASKKGHEGVIQILTKFAEKRLQLVE